METKKYKTPDTEALFQALKQECDDFIVNGQWYEWYDDGCPYDSSGQVRPLTVSKAEYIKDVDVHEQLHLLHYIHTGSSEATYESGCGLHWTTLADQMQTDLDDIAYKEMLRLNVPADMDVKSDEYDALREDICEQDDYEYLDVVTQILEHYTKDVVLALCSNFNACFTSQ